jgi:meso-butanediol dehydrogenase/(S,S)-butanediol dehydrogenase/diacetyl reductase
MSNTQLEGKVAIVTGERMTAKNAKVALITGGTRGIGRAIVERYLKEGMSVITCGRNNRPDDLDAAVDWYTADVANSEVVEGLRDAIISKHGALDVLVNNAGIQIEKTVVDSTDDDWDLLMGINAKGVFNCCRTFIPLMVQSEGGSIINIGSISGRAADPEMALYNASKSFVHGLTRSIAVDHGKQGIRCNAICPGWIMTGMADAAFELADDPEAAQKDALARHYIGRFGQPSDIANMAHWLASDDASYTTGQMFTVDGGLTAASPVNPALF